MRQELRLFRRQLRHWLRPCGWGCRCSCSPPEPGLRPHPWPLELPRHAAVIHLVAGIVPCTRGDGPIRRRCLDGENAFGVVVNRMLRGTSKNPLPPHGKACRLLRALSETGFLMVKGGEASEVSLFFEVPYCWPHGWLPSGSTLHPCSPQRGPSCQRITGYPRGFDASGGLSTSSRSWWRWAHERWWHPQPCLPAAADLVLSNTPLPSRRSSPLSRISPGSGGTPKWCWHQESTL